MALGMRKVFPLAAPIVSQRGWSMNRCIPPFMGFLVIVGCGKPPTLPVPDAEPGVSVSEVVSRTVQETIDFTGRIDSPNPVDIRPRATGYITSTTFKEGDLVKKDDVLFEIDKRPYKAKLDDAVGQVKLYQAKLKLAIADNLRAKEVAKTPGAISKQDLDKYVAAEEEAKAAVEAVSASLEVHRLNLEFCQVISPISGRISRYYVTLGNLVNADQTLLTTIVSEDPVYAYFDVDEASLIRLKRMIQEKKIPTRENRPDIFVNVSIQDELDYPHKALVNFLNNKVDPLTGTLTVRAAIENPPISSTTRLFVPGMFCRVRVPIGLPHPGILVSEKAIGTDQSVKFVYVVGPESRAEYRKVSLGATDRDGLRIVEDGIKPGEKVIVSGIQLVAPGQKVVPESIPMPIPMGAKPARTFPVAGGKS